jgi:CHASE2 domain-containing sensor protein
MKESAKSLRAYFILVGVYGLYRNGTQLADSPAPLLLVLAALSLAVAVGFVAIGAMLPSLLEKGTTAPINVVLGLSALVNVLYGALVMALAPTVFPLVVAAIGVGICGYLYVNVKRLAAEAKSGPPAAA